MDRQTWFKNAKRRLVATLLGAVSAIAAAGLLFDWRAALAVLVAELLACLAYSLRNLHKQRERQE
ncbi:MAG: hypothetical protein FWC72_05025 [Oscillospiraceae bacterium]|nr:hypothetical protein [Oscillospiraceae bacterium]